MIYKALLTEQLKRFWAVPAVAGLALFLLGPLGLFLTARNEDSWALNANFAQLVRLNSGVTAVMLFLPMAAAWFALKCYANKSEMAALYALPAKKTAVQLTGALAGIIMTALPILFVCLVLLFPLEYREPSGFGAASFADGPMTFAQANFAGPLFPGAPASEGDAINPPPTVALLFVRLLVIALFNFAVFWLAFSLAGNGVIANLLAGSIGFLAMLFPSLVNGLALVYVFGAPTNSAVFALRHELIALPISYWVGDAGQPSSGGALFAQILVYSLAAAALGTAAFLISGLRKAERTGDSIVFAPVKNFLVFLVSLGFGIIVSAIAWNWNPGNASFYLGLGGGFVAGYFISQMIAEKSFAVWHKAKYLGHFLGAMAALYASFHLFAVFGTGFYTARVPDDALGVSVRIGSNENWEWRRPEFWMLDNPEVIAMAARTHRNIVGEMRSLRQSPWASDTFLSWGRDTAGFSIDYLLPNGRVMQRHYVLPLDRFGELGILELLSQRDVILQNHELLRFPEFIRSVDFSSGSEGRIDGVWHSERRLHGFVRSEEAVAHVAERLTEHLVGQGHSFAQWLETGRSGPQAARAAEAAISEWHSLDFDIFREADMFGGAGGWWFNTSWTVSGEFFNALMEEAMEIEAAAGGFRDAP